MKINPSIMSSAINRYEKAIRQPNTKSNSIEVKDKIDFSQNAKVYNKLMKQAMAPENINTEKVNGIMNQISAGTYQLDSKKIAEAMLE